MRTDMHLFAAGVLLVVCCQTAYGAVSIQNPTVDVENFRPVPFCWYNGIRFAPGSNFFNLHGCENCTCTLDGLNCYTSGRITGIPAGSACTTVRAGCKDFWVMRNSIREDCPEHMIPPHGMVGK